MKARTPPIGLSHPTVVPTNFEIGSKQRAEGDDETVDG